MEDILEKNVKRESSQEIRAIMSRGKAYRIYIDNGFQRDSLEDKTNRGKLEDIQDII